MTTVEEELAQIEPGGRVLLLAQCLRPSQSCPGKFDKKGLQCPPGCHEKCAIGRFRDTANELGYKGVCIAAGGAMAVRFIKEHSPLGIVAVACDKELAEGINAVKELAGDEEKRPPIIAVPLSKDGCVDTEVDKGEVLRAINLGCTRK